MEVMEILVREWAGPDETWIKEGAALLQAFCMLLFENYEFTNDYFDLLHPSDEITVFGQPNGPSRGYEEWDDWWDADPTFWYTE